MKIILASGSPRRKDLLRSIGLSPEIHVPNIHEEKQDHESATEYIKRNTKEKLEAVAKELPKNKNQDYLLIAADTIVVFQDEVLEKPLNQNDAKNMLLKIQGKTHKVLTGYGIMKVNATTQSEAFISIEKTDVTLSPMDANTIQRYIETGEPMDKAGSYGAQGIGAVFIKSLTGAYTNVVGLPLAGLRELCIKQFHFDLFR